MVILLKKKNTRERSGGWSPVQTEPATVLGDVKQEINTQDTFFPSDCFRFLPTSKLKKENDVGVLCKCYTPDKGEPGRTGTLIPEVP